MRKTFNIQHSTFNKKRKNLLNAGFTFIELLITVTLLGIVGTLVTQVFILGFRAQNKSEIMKEVKQNGDYALSVMESMIRSAEDISADCNTSTNQLTVLNPDGLTTTFICTNNSSIASQSAWLTSSLTSNKVIASNCSSAFRIVCHTPPLNPKYVFINFTLKQAPVAGQGQ